jgi:glyoxylase-like metal-dependent hydrolase (beta-lactamase superfamily II)
MKKLILILFFTLLIPFTLESIYPQNNNTEKKNTIDPNKWFSCKKINENIWRIDDHNLANIYLVIGKDSVLIIDTGMGLADLKGYVKSLIDLPVIVVNTHGHGDHAAGDDQFDKAYINPYDSGLVHVPVTEASRISSKNFMRNFLGENADIPEVPVYTKHARLIPIQDGHVFDLGDRKVEVISTPGHTKGSICLLDRTSGILITGDNNNSQTWLFIKTSEPLEIYKKSLEKLISRKKEFTLLLPGHGDPYDPDFLDENLTCVNNILSGNCEVKTQITFAGEGKSCSYKRALIIFNPDNLFVK